MPVGTSDGEFFNDEFDHSVQTYFKGSVTSPVEDTSKLQSATQVPLSNSNAPATSTARPGPLLRDSNLGDILGMDVHDIPEGVSAKDFIKQLQSQTDEKYGVKGKKPVITASK